jgi:hypothetical protein
MKQNSTVMKERFGLAQGLYSIISFYDSAASSFINLIGLFKRQHLFGFRRAIKVSHPLFLPGPRLWISIYFNLVNFHLMSSWTMEVEIVQLQNLTLDFQDYSYYCQMDQY